MLRITSLLMRFTTYDSPATSTTQLPGKIFLRKTDSNRLNCLYRDPRLSLGTMVSEEWRMRMAGVEAASRTSSTSHSLACEARNAMWLSEGLCMPSDCGLNWVEATGQQYHHGKPQPRAHCAAVPFTTTPTFSFAPAIESSTVNTMLPSSSFTTVEGSPAASSAITAGCPVLVALALKATSFR